MRDSILLYRSTLKGLLELPAEDLKASLRAITDYALDEIEGDYGAVANAALAMTKPLIDSNNRKAELRRNRSEQNGTNRNKSEQTVTNENKTEQDGTNSDNAELNVKREKVNNKKEIIKDMLGKPDGMDKSAINYRAVIDYLNQKTGKHFLDKSKDTRRLIRARYEEGYTLDDFKKVIDNTSAKWRDDPRMCDYLRPVTLFGTKFESYLNMIATRSGMETHGFDYDALEKQLLRGGA